MKLGHLIAKNRVMILLISLALLVPSALGYLGTRVNYDLLSYLPESLETVMGQNIMVDEYGIGAFAILVVEGMEPKDMEKLASDVEEIPHVKSVLWYGSVLNLSVPVSMIPERISRRFVSDDATMLIAFLDDTTSADPSMDAVVAMRKVANKDCFVAGMTGIVTDIKDLCLSELPVYVVIAAILCFLVLELTTESFLVPLLFLLCIGISIVYNLGSNIFLGQISYVTQALAAVLQLAVTMDYSIFLLESYEEQKHHFPEDREKAMGVAIAETFRSVIASSITTVAGFLALCVMTFGLGMDIGVVMSKGVLIGVLCCVTVLPALVLFFDKAIEKTKHRPFIKQMNGASSFVTKHVWLWVILFGALLLPSLYGSSRTPIYYNIAQSLPDDILSNEANAKLKEDFDMNVIHMVMLNRDLDAKSKRNIVKDVQEVEGVQWAIGLTSLLGPTVPESMAPKKIRDMLQSEHYELEFICSAYPAATDESNAQLAKINEIVKHYDPTGMVIGEAPLMKDLQDVNDVDMRNVNFLSIAAIFVIILLTFKSISLPIILVSVIEMAININMAVPFFQGKSLPFVASVVVGTIQLGATVDYAILMTNRYMKERQAGVDKKHAVETAHKASMLSIITSGTSFFMATFGVSAYSRVDMIGSICTLLSRGALISMVVVLLLLPSCIYLLDPFIIRTTAGFGEKARKSHLERIEEKLEERIERGKREQSSKEKQDAEETKEEV